MAPLCSPWSQWSNMKSDQDRTEYRNWVMPRVRFCAHVAMHQVKHGRKFIIENPRESFLWYVHCFQDLLRISGVTYGNLEFCAFGMRDPETNG